MKFQKNGGKIGIPKKKSYEIPIKWGEKLEFVGFSLSSLQPVFLINFEKILGSKETSYQNSKNHMHSASL